MSKGYLNHKIGLFIPKVSKASALLVDSKVT